MISATIFAWLNISEFSKFDQDSLNEKVKQWKANNWDTSYVGDKESSSPKFTVGAPRKMAAKNDVCSYGNCVTLIDTTYKTMHYDFPLFCVCGRTNVNYCVVAEFVTQNKTAEAIQEALEILKTWKSRLDTSFCLKWLLWSRV